MSQTDSFLMLCRENYFLRVFPADLSHRNTELYQRLVRLAKAFFDENQEDKFAEFLVEGHYFVQLWAAHLILEHGNPNLSTKSKCIEMIKSYTENPLAPDVAKQERLWLEDYLKVQ